MGSHSPLPCYNIKVEEAFETAHVHSSVKEMTTKNQVSDMVDSKLPVRFKIEQPQVEDKKKSAYSQSAPSIPIQEHSQMEKMMYDNMDFKFVKQELSDELCVDRNKKPGNLVDVTDCSSGHGINGHSTTESRTTLNSYEQEHANYSKLSENISSLFEINTTFFWADKNCHLHIDMGTKTGDKPNLSDVCSPTVSVDSCLIRQKRISIEEKPFKCDSCGASFSKPGFLMIHKRTHTEERPYKCDDCGASFAQADYLRNHMRTHTGERPYKCDDCGASFARFGSLKGHKRTHTGERPYKCCDCGASFALSDNLNRHKRKHTGERPYICNKCGASFTNAGPLKVHQRKHTGERPYKCDDCGVSFDLAIILKIHKRIHTSDRP